MSIIFDPPVIYIYMTVKDIDHTDNSSQSELGLDRMVADCSLSATCSVYLNWSKQTSTFNYIELNFNLALPLFIIFEIFQSCFIILYWPRKSFFFRLGIVILFSTDNMSSRQKTSILSSLKLLTAVWLSSCHGSRNITLSLFKSYKLSIMFVSVSYFILFPNFDFNQNGLEWSFRMPILKSTKTHSVDIDQLTKKMQNMIISSLYIV